FVASARRCGSEDFRFLKNEPCVKQARYITATVTTTFVHHARQTFPKNSVALRASRGRDKHVDGLATQSTLFINQTFLDRLRFDNFGFDKKAAIGIKKFLATGSVQVANELVLLFRSVENLFRLQQFATGNIDDDRTANKRQTFRIS